MMPTWRYLMSSVIMPRGHAAKYIVDPKKAIIVHVHSVVLFVEGYRRYYVKPHDIAIRHYRSIYSGNWIEYGVPKIEMFGDFSISSYPAKYMKTLRENVQQRLQYVYGGMH
uniref:Glycosyltransferase family 92 protein n=1 Tax=Angiostrongylus cantonensis TaxID=6313 RepID=A0A0K0D883_ANGCA